MTAIDEDALGRPDVIVVDSVTDLGPTAAGRIAVTGSHGGAFSGAFAAARGVRAALFNDAGFGLDAAGVGGVASAMFPAAAVDHRGARIGEGAETAHGLISFVNAAAAQLGVQVGDHAARAVRLLAQAPPRSPGPDPESVAHCVDVHGVKVTLLDSASQIGTEHAHCFVAVGSHGAAPGGDPRRAVRHPVAFVAFNDAGRGKEDAGVARLALLDRINVPAVAVAHDSARIGDGASTLFDGVVSAGNQTAHARGVRTGERLHDLYARVGATGTTHP